MAGKPLLAYVIGGDPDFDTSLEIVARVFGPAAGVDVIGTWGLCPHRFSDWGRVVLPAFSWQGNRALGRRDGTLG